MNSDFVIYVDFDSTLYDTSAFSKDLWAMIAHKAGETIDQVKAESASHFFHPTLGGYEYEKHIAKYHLDPEPMWQELEASVETKNYLYKDSQEFMQSLLKDGYHPKILTFGEKRFQLAKIHPALKFLDLKNSFGQDDVIVVDRKKNEHIELFHQGQKGVLIDDKPDQELPAGFTEIYLDRNSIQNSPQIKNNIAIVSDLNQARELITKLN